LDVACAVLDQLTPELRANIRERGREAVERLQALQAGLDGLITGVQGTGLLFSCELAPQFKCYGADSTEEWLREHGIGVIHGGANSLRFTPRFETTSDELELLVSMVGRALREGPRRDRDTAARGPPAATGALSPSRRQAATVRRRCRASRTPLRPGRRAPRTARPGESARSPPGAARCRRCWRPCGRSPHRRGRAWRGRTGGTRCGPCPARW